MGFSDARGTAETLGDIVTGELEVNAAEVRARGLVHVDCRLQLGADRVVLTTSTVTEKSALVADSLGADIRVCSNVVYVRPWPNGRAGVLSALVISDGPPRIGCR